MGCNHRQKLIDKMHFQMTKMLDYVMQKSSQDSSLKTRRHVLTLASIVRKKLIMRRKEEKLAGIFINRLKKGIKLQADPLLLML